jgi:hypothetical protein
MTGSCHDMNLLYMEKYRTLIDAHLYVSFFFSFFLREVSFFFSACLGTVL